jgi:hypothetical protein
VAHYVVIVWNRLDELGLDAPEPRPVMIVDTIFDKLNDARRAASKWAAADRRTGVPTIDDGRGRRSAGEWYTVHRLGDSRS